MYFDLTCKQNETNLAAKTNLCNKSWLSKCYNCNGLRLVQESCQDIYALSQTDSICAVSYLGVMPFDSFSVRFT